MTDIDAPQAAGWYPDPEGVAERRFWNGSDWTEHTKGLAARAAAPAAHPMSRVPVGIAVPAPRPPASAAGPAPSAPVPAPSAPVSAPSAPVSAPSAPVSAPSAPVSVPSQASAFAPPLAGTALADPPSAPAPTSEEQRNGIATAAVVLGAVSIVLDVLFVPMILAIVFGAIGIGRAGSRGGAGRARAIVAIVLAVVGLPIQAAIAIPVFIGVQNGARIAAIPSDIENAALNQGVRLDDLSCPTSGFQPVAGAHLTCTATQDGHRVLIDVVLGADGRPATMSERQG